MSKPLPASELLRIRVTAGARRDALAATLAEDGSLLYRVHVRAVAENGKANQEVISILSKNFNIPKSSISILKGATNRNKLVQIIR